MIVRGLIELVFSEHLRKANIFILELRVVTARVLSGSFTSLTETESTLA